MNKKFFALPLAALAVASCSNNDELASVPQNGIQPVAVAPNSQELQFFPVAQGNTRGAVATDANIIDTVSVLATKPGADYGFFYVITKGYYYDVLKHSSGENLEEDPENLANDLKNYTAAARYVSYNPKSSSWSIQEVKESDADDAPKYGPLYWQDDEDPEGFSGNTTAAANKATFMAIAGLDQRMTHKTIGGIKGDTDWASTEWTSANIYDRLKNLDPTKVPVVVNNLVENQRDVTVAYSEGVQKDLKEQGIKLHFRHAMSQINFVGTYAIDDAMTEQLPAADRLNFGDLVVHVKEACVVNAYNTGNLALPKTATTSGQAYDATWTVWSDQGYQPNAIAYNPAVPTWNLKTYADMGYAYRSELASPQELVKDQKAIDNVKEAGPMLLLPQTMEAATEIKEGFANNDDAAKQTKGAFIMLKVNIQRNFPTAEGAARWVQWYPANGKNVDYRPVIDAGKVVPTFNEGDVTNKTKVNGAAQTLANIKDNEEDWAYIAVPIAFDWKPGYKYTFVLNFTNFAAGWFAPNWFTGDDAANKYTATIPYYNSDTAKASYGDAVIPGVHKPVTFAVTVESTWEDGGTTAPQLQ